MTVLIVSTKALNSNSAVDLCAQLGIENPYFALVADKGLARRARNCMGLSVPILALNSTASAALKALKLPYYELFLANKGDKFAAELQLEDCRDYLEANSVAPESEKECV